MQAYEKETKLKEADCQKKDKHNMETLKRENSILATQLRDMQDELANNSNISNIVSKNANSLEITNNILSERCNLLERENREYEEKFMILSDSQTRSNLQGITKLKNKLSRLKEDLTMKTNQ